MTLSWNKVALGVGLAVVVAGSALIVKAYGGNAAWTDEVLAELEDEPAGQYGRGEFTKTQSSTTHAVQSPGMEYFLVLPGFSVEMTLPETTTGRFRLFVGYDGSASVALNRPNSRKRMKVVINEPYASFRLDSFATSQCIKAAKEQLAKEELDEVHNAMSRLENMSDEEYFQELWRTDLELLRESAMPVKSQAEWAVLLQQRRTMGWTTQKFVQAKTDSGTVYVGKRWGFLFDNHGKLLAWGEREDHSDESGVRLLNVLKSVKLSSRPKGDGE